MTELQAHEESTKPDNEDVAREEMADGVETFIIEPLAILAGLIAEANTEDSRDVLTPREVGRLLGLIVRGARAELEIHTKGGYRVKALRDMLAAYGVDLDTKTAA